MRLIQFKVTIGTGQIRGAHPNRLLISACFSLDEGFWRIYVQMNMRIRLRQIFNNRRRRRNPPQLQLELNLWPKRQTVSKTFLRKSAMTRSVHWR